MKPLRNLAAAGVVGAAAFGGTLFAELFGVPDNIASGQTLMARAPSVLTAPRGYASTPGYNALPGYYSTGVHNSAPGYAAVPSYVPSYVPQPTPSPYGYAAYPATGYGPTYAQLAPSQVPYQAPTVQPAWPYVQSNDGQASVMLGRGESLGGPALASPQLQLPTPSQQTPLNHLPTQQAPNYPMQTQPMQGYGMQGYSYGAGTCDVYAQPVVRNWFGSAGGLVMTRDSADHYTFSYGTGSEADQFTDTRDADMDWGGGVDIRFGRYFNCQRNAIEAVYWGLYPGSQSTQTTSADVLGNLNGILNWNSLDYGGGPADVRVNVAPGNDGIHQLTREYAFQNLELNLWQFCGSCGTGKCNCSRLRTNWLVGVRYFQFDEDLLFASNADGQQITQSDDEIFYEINIENHLLGFQVGNQLQYCLTDKLTADLGTKLGIYGNRINHASEIGGNLGTATINNGPFAGEQFWIGSSKNDVAFLGEVNVGLRYCLNCNWTGTLGYRALAITGVAMPADQIYPDLRGINDVENIDSSRGMILHGGYAGLQYNW